MPTLIHMCVPTYILLNTVHTVHIVHIVHSTHAYIVHIQCIQYIHIHICAYLGFTLRSTAQPLYKYACNDMMHLISPLAHSLSLQMCHRPADDTLIVYLPVHMPHGGLFACCVHMMYWVHVHVNINVMLSPPM